jgi:hypothetical protein
MPVIQAMLGVSKRAAQRKYAAMGARPLLRQAALGRRWPLIGRERVRRRRARTQGNLRCPVPQANL